MGEGRNKTNDPTDERIIVAVTHVGEQDRGQASMIDDRHRAERIVESLVEHGIEPEAVTAMKAREIPFDISYRWEVQLVDNADEERRRKSALGRVSRLATAGLKALHDLAPVRPLDLRIDRMVWMGLWIGSLFVLGVSVLASMSSGSAREVVVEIPVEQLDGAAGSPAAPSPVASPLNQNSSAVQTPAVGAAARAPECVAGGIDDCTCADFGTQPVAQAFFEVHPPGPGQIVDPDGNGVMCEWLPDS
jgi:hypothetical protein